MITTITHQHSQGQQQKKHMLRALLITPEIDHRLISIFENCGYDSEEASYEKAKRKIIASQYDLFCIEVNPDDNQGFGLIPLLKVINPMAYVISITKDNQRIVEEKARILKVNYHLVSPYALTEINSILTHLATRKIQSEERTS